MRHRLAGGVMVISLVGAACGGSDGSSPTTVATPAEPSDAADPAAPSTVSSAESSEETAPPSDSSSEDAPATDAAPPPSDSGSPTSAAVEAFITSTGCEIDPDIGRGDVLIRLLSDVFAGAGALPAELIVTDQSFSCVLVDVAQFFALSTESESDAAEVAAWLDASNDPDWCAPIATAGTWVFVNIGRFGEDVVFDYMLGTVREFDGGDVISCQ